MKKLIPILIIVLALISLPPILSVPLLIYIIIRSGFFLSWNSINWSFFWFK